MKTRFSGLCEGFFFFFCVCVCVWFFVFSVDRDMWFGWWWFWFEMGCCWWFVICRKSKLSSSYYYFFNFVYTKTFCLFVCQAERNLEEKKKKIKASICCLIYHIFFATKRGSNLNMLFVLFLWLWWKVIKGKVNSNDKQVGERKCKRWGVYGLLQHRIQS